MCATVPHTCTRSHSSLARIHGQFGSRVITPKIQIFTSCISILSSGLQCLMDPSFVELASISDIGGVFQWLDISSDVAAALRAAIGDHSSLRAWARVPPARFAAAISALTVTAEGTEGPTTRPLSPMEEGQVGDVVRVAGLALRATMGPQAPGLAASVISLPVSTLANSGETASGREAVAEQPTSGREAVVGGASGSQEGGGEGTPSGEGRPTAEGTHERHHAGLPLGGVTLEGPAATLVPGEVAATKLKISTILDQADDTEIKPLSVATLRDMLASWQHYSNDDEPPNEHEEATGDQLSALAFRIKAGGTPYVDFGVWRPHGAEMGRALKFTAHFVTPSGETIRREISGPASFGDWAKAWRVFAFAMEVVGAASRTRLKRYHDIISALNDDYSQMWWVVACADHKMRKSHLERIRRRLAQEHEQLTGVGLPSAFDPVRPWDAAFREAARDRDFWNTEVEKKVLQYVTAQKSQKELADLGFGPIAFAAQPGHRPREEDGSSDGGGPGKKKKKRRLGKGQRQDTWTPPPPANRKGKGKGKGKGKSKHPDGRYRTTADGMQICWAWNEKLGGCSDDNCPNGRAHVCELCLKDHRTCEHRRGGK